MSPIALPLAITPEPLSNRPPFAPVPDRFTPRVDTARITGTHSNQKSRPKLASTPLIKDRDSGQAGLGKWALPLICSISLLVALFVLWPYQHGHLEDLIAFFLTAGEPFVHWSIHQVLWQFHQRALFTDGG